MKFASMPRRARPEAPSTATSTPGTATFRTPKRSNKRPDTRPVKAPMTAPGSMAKPDIVAVNPRVPWMYSGVMTSVPKSAACTMMTTQAAVA